MNDDPVLRARQKNIRNVLNRNERKRQGSKSERRSAKPKGRNWVLSMQTQCAIIGHEETPFTKICAYCKAKMI